MVSLLIFLAVLSVLVLGHELGHYLAARLTGVKAEEFGYGFPPRAVGYVRVKGRWRKVTRKDDQYYENTIWSLNWLPLGGFVRLKGEQGEFGNDKDSFSTKGTWAKLFILSAGVLMNWFMAAAIFSVAFSIGVPAQTDGLPRGTTVRDPRVQITEIIKSSPAERADIQAGDLIRAVDGKASADVDAVRAAIVQGFEGGRKVVLEVERKGETLTKEVAPEWIESAGRPGIGVDLANTGIVRLPVGQAIVQGFAATAMYTKMIFMAFGELLKALVGQSDMKADVAGPIGIAIITGKVADEGWWPLLQFAAMLSINLAIINFLPIPALDGGRTLFVVIEAIRRKKNNAQVEAMVHQIGFVVLLLLVAVVTFNDLRTYGGTIWRGLRGMVGL
jgi:regulator of sigma E protease